MISGEESVIEFHRLLNAEQGFRLDRKWNKLETLIERRRIEAEHKKEEEARVVDTYLQGSTELAAARKHNMGTKRVRAILIGAGAPVKRRRSPTRVSQAIEFSIVADYKNGVKQREIAQTYGLTQARVSTILGKHKVETIPSHIRRMTDMEKAQAIASAYDSGLSQVEVANKFEMSVGGVHKVLKRLNVQMRPPRRYRRKKGDDGTGFTGCGKPVL
jgi:Mor family transcriptional regulator